MDVKAGLLDGDDDPLSLIPEEALDLLSPVSLSAALDNKQTREEPDFAVRRSPDLSCL